MPHPLSRARAAVARVLAFVALGTALPCAVTAQIQQGAAAAAGTIPFANIAPAARDAMLAGVDASDEWSFRTAVDHLDRALTADPAFALARALRAELAGAPTAAELESQYARALADAARRPAGEWAYVGAVRATGIAAARLYATARSFYPNDARLQLRHANSLAGRERTDSLRAIARRRPDDHASRLWLAYHLTAASYSASRADMYEALLVAEDAVAIAPRVAGTHTVLGHVLQRLGRVEEAARHLEAAVRMDRNQEYAFVLLAGIYLHDGKPGHVDRARAMMDSAIAVNPNYARQNTQRINRSFMLFRDGRGTQGLTELAAIARSMEEAGSPPPILYSQMAGLAAGIGDSAGAERWLGESRRVGPNANVSLQAAQAYWLNRQPVEARRELDEFIRRAADTTSVDFRNNLHRLTGIVLLAEGKPAEALEALKRSDAEANPFTTLAMIDAYTALGDRQKAAEVRSALLAQRDRPVNSVAVAVAHHRAARRR